MNSNTQNYERLKELYDSQYKLMREHVWAQDELSNLCKILRKDDTKISADQAAQLFLLSNILLNVYDDIWNPTNGFQSQLVVQKRGADTTGDYQVFNEYMADYVVVQVLSFLDAYSGGRFLMVNKHMVDVGSRNQVIWKNWFEIDKDFVAQKKRPHHWKPYFQSHCRVHGYCLGFQSCGDEDLENMGTRTVSTGSRAMTSVYIPRWITAPVRIVLAFERDQVVGHTVPQVVAPNIIVGLKTEPKKDYTIRAKIGSDTPALMYSGLQDWTVFVTMCIDVSAWGESSISIDGQVILRKLWRPEDDSKDGFVCAVKMAAGHKVTLLEFTSVK